MADLSGEIQEFAKGELIFNEGAPGGDLYFIQEGEVVVFKNIAEDEVELATLHKGEILGIMTCLTASPRLAGARAKTTVTTKIVRKQKFEALIHSIPKWVHTVIKDFILRISFLGEAYGVTKKRLEVLEAKHSKVELGAKMVQGLAVVGDLISFPDDVPRLVNIDACLQHLAVVLNVKPAELETVFGAFVQAGLLKSDPSSSKRMADLAVLERLASFEAVARAYLKEKLRGRQPVSFTSKEAKGLIALAEVAKSKNLNLREEVRITTKDFKEAIALKSTTDYDRGLLLKAQEAKLLQVDTAGKEEAIRYTPASLGIYLKSIKCIKILEKLDAAVVDGASSQKAWATESI